METDITPSTKITLQQIVSELEGTVSSLEAKLTGLDSTGLLIKDEGLMPVGSVIDSSITRITKMIEKLSIITKELPL